MGLDLVAVAGSLPRPSALALSADGRTTATAGDDSTVRVWDVATRVPRPPITFGPDGRIVAVVAGDDRVRLGAVSDLPDAPSPTPPR
jgi:WD40 repeat protein